MLQITLKAKHFFFIVNDLQNIVASRFFRLLIELQNATLNADDEDLITLHATVEDLIHVFQLIAAKPEGQVAALNLEMKTMLNQQIQKGMADGDPLWIEAAIKINELRLANLKITEDAIAAGKLFLHPVKESNS